MLWHGNASRRPADLEGFQYLFVRTLSRPIGSRPSFPDPDPPERSAPARDGRIGVVLVQVFQFEIGVLPWRSGLSAHACDDEPYDRGERQQHDERDRQVIDFGDV